MHNAYRAESILIQRQRHTDGGSDYCLLITPKPKDEEDEPVLYWLDEETFEQLSKQVEKPFEITDETNIS